MASSDTFRRAAERTLEPEVMADLDAVSACVAASGRRVLLVGGMVRDVLLGRSSRDLDLVVVGAGGPLAADLAAALTAGSGAAAGMTPSELMTWRLELPGGRRLDLATARRESYAAPAALPAVVPGDLDHDLARRDFTVNAMAVEIGARWGEVLDPHGGRADLGGGLLRVLHRASFRDDPTRILRGIELAVRLRFGFEPRTLDLAREALAAGTLDDLSAARWRRAWRRAFTPLLLAGAAALAEGLRQAENIGLLAALHPRLRLDAAALARAGRLADRLRLERLRGARRARLLVRALAWEDATASAALGERWALSPADALRWSSFPGRLRAAVEELGGSAPAPPSRLDAALSRFDAEELCLLELASALEEPLELYRTVIAPFRLVIGGHDLEALGHPPGPAFGEALARTRRARLDGLIGEGDELEYACRQLESMER